MCYSKHTALDTFCDKLKPEEEDQVHIGLEELEDSIDEASLEILFDHWENNNQESAPLLPEQQQELRNRVRSRALPGHEDAGFLDRNQAQSRTLSRKIKQPKSREDRILQWAQKPGESFWERVLRLFQEMLSRLQKKWQDLLAWLQKKWASFVRTMEFVWSAIKDFCSVWHSTSPVYSSSKESHEVLEELSHTSQPFDSPLPRKNLLK
ncbi:hypothetical protein QTO34_013443 [Cnephaeus nilssonii]|uniref:Interleukin-32 n=1 Tax=Cnephaeus nilssonii TaxID=3371016 RepID=A0AA40LT24_CNENI|nr:hypothetical protein QTO34_013443 [Eptesicus nilssonii]